MKNNRSKAEKGNLSELSFSSFGRSQEVFALASGVKRNSFLEIKKINLLNSFLKELKFFSPLFDYKFSMARAPAWNKKEAGDYHLTFCIGRKKTEVDKISNLFKEPNPNHREIGTMLGYPFCCVNEQYKPEVDLSKVFKVEKANIIDFRINNFYLRSDVNMFLARHYVCSYRCKKTIDRVDEILNYLRQFPYIRNFYIKNLKKPFLFLFPSPNPQRSIISRGVVFGFKGEYENSKRLNYKKVYYSEKFMTDLVVTNKAKKIYHELLKGNNLRITQEGVDVYLNSNKKSTIKDESLFAFWPKDLLKKSYYYRGAWSGNRTHTSLTDSGF